MIDPEPHMERDLPRIGTAQDRGNLSTHLFDEHIEVGSGSKRIPHSSSRLIMPTERSLIAASNRCRNWSSNTKRDKASTVFRRSPHVGADHYR
jgi:hypothetical protein